MKRIKEMAMNALYYFGLGSAVISLMALWIMLVVFVVLWIEGLL